MDDDERVRRKFLNTYLDAPIIEKAQLDLYGTILLWKLGDRSNVQKKHLNYHRALKSLDPTKYEVGLYDPHDLPALLGGLMETQFSTSLDADRAWSDASTVFRCATRGLEKKMNTKITGAETLPSLPDKTALYLRVSDFFGEFIDRLAVSRVGGYSGLIVHRDSQWELIGDQYSCIWIDYDDHYIRCMTYEGILMWKDMTAGRANVYLGAHACYPGDKKMIETLDYIFEWCESCLFRHGNEGYAILRQLETLAKASMIAYTDPYLGEGGCITRLKDIVITKEQELGTQGDFLADKLTSYLANSPSVTYIVEAFGLQKLTGHPLINPGRGGLSMANEASKEKTTSWRAAMDLRNSWRRMYIEGYINLKGKWPPLIFTPEGKRTQLYQLCVAEEKNITRKSYPMEDLDHIRFEKHVDFDYYTNFTDLMDDRSISYYRSDISATWDKTVHPRSYRRLLLEMLARPDVSLRDIYNTVESRGIPWEWLVICLYPKEREFKLEPRMFSMMVFEMRLFFNCMEANLADHVLPCIPSLTMTDSKQDIIERFLKMMKPSKNQNIVILSTEFDVHRWNVNWRALPINPISMDYDDIFGTVGRFTLVHDFFRRCLVVVRVHGYEPDGIRQPHPPRTDLCWEGHEGGFEGLYQKGWSIPTVAAVDIGLSGFDFSYRTTGQGDNQLMVARIDVSGQVDISEYLRTLSFQINKQVASVFSSVGQAVRQEECIESTSVVTYSKDIYINGAEHYTSLKTLSRIFPRGASDLPSIIDNISSLSSSSIAAAEQNKTPLICYLIGLFHISLYLRRLLRRRTQESAFLTDTDRGRLSDKTITRLLMIPSSLGGLPVPTICNYLWRGSADPLSDDYVHLKILLLGGARIVGSVFTALREGRWVDPKADPRRLLEDPYSIPLLQGLSSDGVVRSSSQSVLRVKTENTAISELMSLSVNDYEDTIVESLLSLRPFNPSLASDLLSLSVVGIRNTVQRMFTSTRTVQSLLEGHESDPGVMLLSASATGFNRVVIRLDNLTAPPSNPLDAFTEVEHLRKMWPDVGTHIVGVTSYCPLDWDISLQAYPIHSEGIKVQCCSGSDRYYIRGNETPYLGSRTFEKRAVHGYKIITSSAADKAYNKLLNIATQPGVSTTFLDLVEKIASTRCAIPLQEMIPLTSRAIGGSICHRYDDNQGSRGSSVIGTVTFASYCVLHSNQAGVLSASLVDYPVFFQVFNTAGIGLLHLTTGRRSDKHSWITFLVPDSVCSLPEDALVCKTTLSGPSPKMTGNPIVYTQDLTLIRVDRPQTSSLIKHVAYSEALRVPDYHLLERLIWRSLQARYIGLSLADKIDRLITIKIDVLELKGICPSDVFKGCSLAVCRYTLTSMFARSHHGLRWNPLPMILTLSDAISRSLIKIIHHPIFQHDELWREIIVSSPMVYGTKHLNLSLSNRISSLSTAYLMDPGSLCYIAPYYVFIDDNVNACADMSKIALQASILRASIYGEITVAQGYDLARRHVSVCLRGRKTADLQLAALQRLTSTVCEWAYQNQHLNLMSHCEAILRGDVVKAVAAPLPILLRTLRKRIRTSIVELPDKRVTTNVVNWEHIIMDDTHQVDDVNIDIPDVLFSSDDGYIIFRIDRLRGRINGGPGTSIYNFNRCGPWMTGKQVLILGAGHGGCTRVATWWLSTNIIVHDLSADLSPKDSMQRPELPYGAAPGYAQSSLVRSTCGYLKAGGDCFDDSFWQDVKRNHYDPETVIIDLRIPTLSKMCYILRQCSVSFRACDVFIRVMGNMRTLAAVKATCSSSPSPCFMSVIFSKNGWCEALIHVRVYAGSNFIPMTVTPSPIPNSEVLDCPKEMEDPEGWLSTYCLGPLGCVVDDPTSEESASILRIAFASAMSDTHSYTYAQWTDILRTAISAEILLNPLHHQTRLIMEIVMADSWMTDIGEIQLNIIITDKLRRYLLSALPRFLPGLIG